MFKPFTETIGNDGIWKEDEGFQTFPFPDKIVDDQEGPICQKCLRTLLIGFTLYEYMS